MEHLEDVGHKEPWCTTKSQAIVSLRKGDLLFTEVSFLGLHSPRASFSQEGKTLKAFGLSSHDIPTTAESKGLGRNVGILSFVIRRSFICSLNHIVSMCSLLTYIIHVICVYYK